MTQVKYNLFIYFLFRSIRTHFCHSLSATRIFCVTAIKLFVVLQIIAIFLLIVAVIFFLLFCTWCASSFFSCFSPHISIPRSEQTLGRWMGEQKKKNNNGAQINSMIRLFIKAKVQLNKYWIDFEPNRVIPHRVRFVDRSFAFICRKLFIKLDFKRIVRVDVFILFDGMPRECTKWNSFVFECHVYLLRTTYVFVYY